MIYTNEYETTPKVYTSKLVNLCEPCVFLCELARAYVEVGAGMPGKYRIALDTDAMCFGGDVRQWVQADLWLESTPPVSSKFDTKKDNIALSI